MLTYAVNDDDADIIGKLIQVEDENMSVTVKHEDQIFKIETNLRGKHNIYNMLPGILMALKLDLTEEKIKQGLERILLTERRMDKFTTTNNIVVYDDTYNASYESVIAGLEILKNEERRKVAILGDILELGEYAEEIHKKIGEFLNDTNIDLIITAGKNSQFIHDEISEKEKHHFANANEVIENLDTLLKENDVVLIKASNGMKFDTIANKLREEIEQI